LLGRFSTRQLRKLLSGALVLVSSRVLRVRAREILAIDVSAAAKQIRIPALYVQASEVRLVDASAVRLLQTLVSHVRVAQFDAPHMLLQVEPVKVARAIESCMADVERAL
jgi:pimeloyl-[acyl-carrier protein] methyl ester esterase